MTRAYLRLLPDFFERKALGVRPDGSRVDPYPPAALGAMIGAICLAEHVNPRGRFKSQRVLEAMLAGPNDEGAEYAAQVPFLIEHNDLVRQPDGSLYLDGWDEIQEGRDMTVNERMARYRDRKRATTPPPTGSNAAVTRNASVTSARVTAKSRTPLNLLTASPPEKNTERARVEGPAGPVLSWLARHRCVIRPGNGYLPHLIAGAARHGPDPMIRGLEELSTAGVQDGDTKGFVFGVIDALDKARRPSPAAVGQVAEKERSRRAVEATKRRIAEVQSIGAVAGSLADHGVHPPGGGS